MDADAAVLTTVVLHASPFFKKKVADTATIHALVGGKSALQNEIIGDVEAEFGETPDGSADLPLGELSKTIGVGCVA